MSVRRIVFNIAASEPVVVRDFYVRLFGLDIVMDHGWIVTLAGEATAAPQLSVVREGGSGAPIPHISVEVDDIDAVHATARLLGATIVYPMTEEPWGVRRFFLRDPVGTLVNVLAHTHASPQP